MVSPSKMEERVWTTEQVVLSWERNWILESESGKEFGVLEKIIERDV